MFRDQTMIKFRSGTISKLSLNFTELKIFFLMFVKSVSLADVNFLFYKKTSILTRAYARDTFVLFCILK